MNPFMTFGTEAGVSGFLKDRYVWLKLDKCPATETITKPYPVSNPKSKAVRSAYGPCDKGIQVRVDSIIGQPHQWPDAANLNQADAGRGPFRRNVKIRLRA